MRDKENRNLGFTLIELMVTISIAGILLAIAIPSFTSVISSNRLTTSANELVTALNLARSEAIKRGIQVTLLRNGSTNQAWEEGWRVFTDINGDGSLDDNGDSNLCETGEDCLLRLFDALPLGYTLRTGANYACWVAYAPNGATKSSGSACTGGGLANDTFRLCDSTQTTSNSRSIAINAIGRSRVSSSAASCP